MKLRNFTCLLLFSSLGIAAEKHVTVEEDSNNRPVLIKTYYIKDGKEVLHGTVWSYDWKLGVKTKTVYADGVFKEEQISRFSIR